MSNTMQWVKASERLPEVDEDFHFKFRGNKYCGKFSNDRLEVIKSDDNIKFYSGDFPEIEWLEELEGGGGMAEALETETFKDAYIERNDKVNELRGALWDLLEAIPKQTEDKDWWPDELTSAVEKARKFYESSPVSGVERKEIDKEFKQGTEIDTCANCGQKRGSHLFFRFCLGKKFSKDGHDIK